MQAQPRRDSSATAEVMCQPCDSSNAAETQQEKGKAGKVA